MAHRLCISQPTDMQCTVAPYTALAQPLLSHVGVTGCGAPSLLGGAPSKAFAYPDSLSLFSSQLGYQPLHVTDIATANAILGQGVGIGHSMPTVAADSLPRAPEVAPAPSKPARSDGGNSGKSSAAYASRHQAAEQRRRTRINERLELLRQMVPHTDRANTASFLEEVIKYIDELKTRCMSLEKQVAAHSPAGSLQHQPQQHLLLVSNATEQPPIEQQHVNAVKPGATDKPAPAGIVAEAPQPKQQPVVLEAQHCQPVHQPSSMSGASAFTPVSMGMSEVEIALLLQQMQQQQQHLGIVPNMAAARADGMQEPLGKRSKIEHM
mmetsp:Transcript_38784/g.79308  ORF Transcript_38784/g.79308 Transcript_38784/m.79308 type:complete len:323 (-) Transcript_38784:613-1581(-)